MKKKHHFFINIAKDSKYELRRVLKLAKIDFTNSEILSCDVYDDNPYLAEIKTVYKKLTGSQEEIFNEFRKEELEEAKYLEIWLRTYSGYPQPENEDTNGMNFQNYTFNLTDYCKHCGCGAVQNNPFYVKKSFILDKKKIGGLYWIYDTLFCDKVVKEFLANSNFKGYEIMPVNSIQTKKERADLFQIKCKNYFPMPLSRNIDKILHCPVCSSHKIIEKTDSITRVSEKIPDTCIDDFYLSQEKFGDGLLCSRKIIISNGVWNFFKGLGIKNIIASPILLEKEIKFDHTNDKVLHAK